MEEKDIIINRLPVKTFGRLGMNESVLKGVAFEGELPVLLSENVSFREVKLSSDEITDIKTGAGPELDDAFDAAKIPVNIAEIMESTNETARIFLDLDSPFSQGKRFYFKVSSGISFDMVMKCSGKKESEKLCALSTKLVLEKGAHVRIIQFLDVPGEASFINDLGAVCGDGASLELIQISSGGKVYQSFYTELSGDDSILKADNGYKLKGDELLDLNYVVSHEGKRTRSTILSRGCLSENAKKIFRGTIDLKKGCAGAIGNEKEDVLLLDDTVVNQSIPLILCAEEDVEGNHGATIGRPDEEMLFYLTSRGISEKEAMEILIEANLSAVYQKIWDKEILKDITCKTSLDENK